MAGLTLLAVASPLRAQDGRGRAAGRVTRLDHADSLPVAGLWVVLHRVGRQIQGPIDSTRSDAGGHFAFRFPVDTSALYLLSARYATVEYFSSPIHLNPQLPDTAIQLVVSDTSSSVPVLLEGRHLVVSRPERDGTRHVLEIATLANRGWQTRLAPDTLHPSWAMHLPAGVVDVQPAQGDFSPDAISIRGDSALLFAPVSPGEKQLSLSYTLPARVASLVVPFEGSVASVVILLEEPEARVLGATFSGTAADTQSLGGRHFRRWIVRIAGPTELRIRFGTDWTGVLALPLSVLLVGAGLLAGAWWALRRRAPEPVRPEEPDLVDAIARLDARYRDREAEVDPEEWQRYLTERARLKSSLAGRLAPRRRRA